MGEQITAIQKKRTINCRGKLVDLSTPVVMGILNVTPDSFFDGGEYDEKSKLIERAQKHLDEGATILDVGAVSTRPKAEQVSASDEHERLIPAIKELRSHFPDAVLSADTYRAEIAKAAIEAGADMINDIGGGTMDDAMFDTITDLQVPYVMMHIQGSPESMQDNPQYNDVTNEVLEFFIQRVHSLRQKGLHDLIIDPGFGFGKTVEHNYQLLNGLERFDILECPILCGFSRKSMVNRVLGTKPETALNGTTVLNTLALERGASILRVHDVKEAVEVVRLVSQLRGR